MTDIWVPGFGKVPTALSERRYDETQHPKAGWHTWEGTNFSAAETSFRPYPPHIACKVSKIKGKLTVEVRQYVPLNVHSFSFRGSENDDEFVIQIEVAGFAHETRGWDDATLRLLGENVLAPINAALAKGGMHTIPSVVAPQGFHDDTEGIRLASTRSPIRMSNSQFESFSGHLGHQHAPAPDEHWDPGKLNVAKIAYYSDAKLNHPIASTWHPFPLDGKKKPSPMRKGEVSARVAALRFVLKTEGFGHFVDAPKYASTYTQGVANEVARAKQLHDFYVHAAGLPKSELWIADPKDETLGQAAGVEFWKFLGDLDANRLAKLAA